MPEPVSLVVVAHPDDVELTCGGTIVRWVRDGESSVLLVATDGARGGKYQGTNAEEVVAERRQEQREAASILGFEDVEFLGFPDGELQDDETLRETLVRHIRRVQPSKVVTIDPLTVIFRNSYVNHRDHRILGMSLLDALYPQASNAGYFPAQLDSGLTLHKVPEVLLAQSDRPNHWVDVSDSLEIRFRALRAHASQMKLWPDRGEAVIHQQRELAALLGLEHGVRYAEEFRRVVVNPLA